jgi:N-acetylmuramoyl-L-alanine amidase
MADSEAPVRRLSRPFPRAAAALVLALAALVVFVAASASADKIDAPVGPVCFFQDGHPICVDRAETNTLTEPSAVSPGTLLATLLQGPTPEERARNVESAIPLGTGLVSVQAAGISVTVRLAFPKGFLGGTLGSSADEALSLSSPALDVLSAEAIDDQIYRTLFPWGYRHLVVEAEDPNAPGVFRPVSTYLPALALPEKGNPDDVSTQSTESVLTAASQPPDENLARPHGALSGKTIYLSAGHGWQWTGSNWYTQRPPYPDATMDYYGPIIEDHNNAEVVNQYLLRYLWNAGADVWTARERDLNGFESVVDNDAPSFAVSGAWESMDGDGYAGRYLRATTDGSGSATATWTSNPVPADGAYSLYVWYVSGPDRTRDARYTVHHAGGTTELSVDQLHHGYTWRYVGRFPVRGGESLVVSLSNRSNSPGGLVVADAMRLGGGWFDSGDLASNGGPVETDAPYGPEKPWWEVSAYYNVQRLGVDPDDFSYFNDVVARPLWAKWEHGSSGEDAVFISWHTNGYNGHNTTRRGTVSFIHSSQAVAGSVGLRQAVHSELINDIRAGWDPTWVDLGMASRDLGELRELWDADASNALPGVLLEVAYHDHATDTDALKDPRFALISARAVYQGIVKYYGASLPLLPEPPTHAAARNVGVGQIKVSWRPSPVDGVGLVGDAAESYRVYTSRDGLGWDNGREVSGTETTLTGLGDNELVFVKVTAVNAGGESFPTPVLAARTSPEGTSKVLLVDGFDRIDRHGLIIDNDPVEGTNARLFPDQINSYNYAVKHGENIALPFDSAVNEAVADGNVNLGAYAIIDWILGEESTESHTFDTTEQAILADYLEQGGALFVSGAEIGWDLVSKDNGRDFYRTYLGADMVGDDADTYHVQPTAEGIFTGLGIMEFRDGYDVDFPDQLAPRPGSIVALDYAGGLGGVAAVQYNGAGCRRVVHLGFPFETLAATKRAAVMDRVMSYLGSGSCLASEPNTFITSPSHGAAFNVPPQINGTAGGDNPIQRVDVQLVDPEGRFWNGGNWTTDPVWLTANGTTNWQYAAPSQGNLIEGEYNLWARAWDTETISDTTPAFANFVYDTIPPAMPMLVSPPDGSAFSPLPTNYSWTGPPDDAGSPLSYSLQVDDLLVIASEPPYTKTIWLPNGEHVWRVRTQDAAGNTSPWTDIWSFVVEHRDWYFPIFPGTGALSGS